MTETLGLAAEALVIRDGEKVLKTRLSKSYRLPELDTKLRRARTRREAKILDKLAGKVRVPVKINADDNTMTITMSYIDGQPLQRIEQPLVHAEELGRQLALLHAQHIIHGDLTTSNILVNKEGIHLIDFGLSFVSMKAEDKAVDLHVLLQCFRAAGQDDASQAVLKSYEKHGSPDVIKRLSVVENRGRNKKKHTTTNV